MLRKLGLAVGVLGCSAALIGPAQATLSTGGIVPSGTATLTRTATILSQETSHGVFTFEYAGTAQVQDIGGGLAVASVQCSVTAHNNNGIQYVPKHTLGSCWLQGAAGAHHAYAWIRTPYSATATENFGLFGGDYRFCMSGVADTQGGGGPYTAPTVCTDLHDLP